MMISLLWSGLFPPGIYKTPFIYVFDLLQKNARQKHIN